MTVPGSEPGVLVFGEQVVSYHDRKDTAATSLPDTMVFSCCPIDQQGSRYIFGKFLFSFCCPPPSLLMQSEFGSYSSSPLIPAALSFSSSYPLPSFASMLFPLRSGDARGGLHLLVLEGRPQGAVSDLTVRPLGFTSTPSALAYLDDGVVFVGSQRGDSQVRFSFATQFARSQSSIAGPREPWLFPFNPDFLFNLHLSSAHSWSG